MGFGVPMKEISPNETAAKALAESAYAEVEDSEES